MKVDINLVLEETPYTPTPGIQYELAPGKWGTMKRPTAELMETVGKLLEEGNADDLAISRAVLAGLPKFEDSEVIFGMPSRAASDFFLMLSRIGSLLKKLSEPSAPSDNPVSAEPE